MAGFLGGSVRAEDLDEALRAAQVEDTRDTLSAAYTREASARAPSGRARRAGVLTAVGRVEFGYRYAGKGRGAAAVVPEIMGMVSDAAGGDPAPVRATPGARRLVAESTVLQDSVRDSCDFLERWCGLAVSSASALKIVRRAGILTERMWEDAYGSSCFEAAMRIIECRNEEDRIGFEIEKGLREDDGKRHRRHPARSRHVGLTVAFSSDGTGAPCVHADTQGAKGRDGDGADTKEVKLLTITFYDRVDGKGRPIVHPGCVFYYASTERIDAFVSKVNGLAQKAGCGGAVRLQFISDGAKWLERIWREVFGGTAATRPGWIRAVDFYHAAEYLAKIVREIVPPGEFAARMKALAGHMKRKGARRTLEKIRADYGKRALAGLTEEGRKALAYIEARLDYMDYGRFRGEGFYVGSGTVESGCKSVVAARCKLAGMHWRLVTVGAVAILRATLRSNLPIAA